jgi:predicted NBD/HSP70 family sugar kinase
MPTRAVQPATAGEVFRLIRDGTAATRSEIGHRTGLSRTAVVNRLFALIDAGLVREVEEPASGVGRPPTRLAFNTGAGTVLAAAIGRSRTQVAVCDLGGEVIADQDVEQEIGLGPHELMPRVVDALGAVLGRAGRDPISVRGIGVSVPGTVNPAGKCSQDAPIMRDWHGVPLDPYFTSLTDAPVSVDNDTNVIARAERSGYLLKYGDALIVKASTGFGAGIVAGGELQHGALGAAGEIGHVKYPPAKGRPCRCGETGCLEAVAGGWALVAELRERGVQVAHIREVVTRAVAGDPDARRAIRRSGRQLGEVLAAAVTLLNPAAIVVGGDMAPAYDVFVAGLRETLYRDASAIATRELQIVAATHGAQSGVRGCAALALDDVLNPTAVDRGLHARLQ